MRTLTPAVATAVHVGTLARQNGRPVPPNVMAVLDEAAAPYPGRWFLPRLPGDPIRVLEVFAGPGGWSEGMTTVLGLNVDVVGIDISKDACATARAAGHFRICADVTTMDPEHYALREVSAAIFGPPCPPFSPAGKHSGRERENIDILCRVLAQCSEAGGFCPPDDIDYEYGDDCDDPDQCEKNGYHDGFAPRSGLTWDDLRAQLAPLTDPRIGLMAEVLIWTFGMLAAGALLEFVAMEQSHRLPQQILQDISLELRGGQGDGVFAGGAYGVLEASEFGLASRRERVFLIAGPSTVLQLPEAPDVPVTSMAQALGWGPGERINTRGARPVDPVTGRPKGGNEFSADRPSNCLTGKARTWYRVSDGLRLTPGEAGLLVGFRPAHPWQGARSSAFQQPADVVPPIMAGAVLGALFSYRMPNLRWQPRVTDYTAYLYRWPDLYAGLGSDDFDTAA
ncbi:DNA cytosine methyltransferase [Streptomyces sp. R302]|uniref:DNA cytosine methyltransferase n=1 Tax=unclassified Streptomyces TaxID=2593676 RepID=UPI00145F80E1|nr:MULTISPECIES: DNA cytosine methyltransferase [unclassified Streptomyces]NML55108.1 DNA cytosine methyltransferase [Streptomyces sp. R301]NML83862.1 DNA cytosine methyltransferase [Streptomyces sp. R302]